MKRIISIVLAVCLTLAISTTCFAHNVDNKEYGISFTLSDDWVNMNGDDSILFHHKVTQEEGVCMKTIDSDWAWSMEFADENEVKNLCESMYSDSKLSQELTSQNNAFVTVSTDSVISSYEYYNNVQYFRYEKAYTARAIGYLDTPFYETVFVTAKNGKLYFISYQRNSKSNHFKDVADMLDSISFKNGEIKIEINNERIYPDSAPMLVEGRTLVPIRAIAEKMGYSVAWDEELQLVTLTALKGKTVLHFEIGSDIALKNFTKKIQLDVPAIVVGDRTYLPLRAVAEAMKAEVNWNDAEKTVEIKQ